MQKRDTVPEDFEWCDKKNRWLWSESSGKINYELPPKEDSENASLDDSFDEEEPEDLLDERKECE